MWRDFFEGFGVRIEFVVLGVETFCMKIGATDPTVFASVVVDVPMLPLALVRPRLPVELVVIVYGPDAPDTMFPVFVVRLTDCIELLPKAALIVIPFVLPPLFTVKLVAALPILIV